MSLTLYEMSNLKKSYDGKIVLNIDSLSIKRGELLAVLGPNGAGKSTLLRLLNFLEAVDDGEIKFYGKTYSFPTPLQIRRKIAMVFQRPVLFKGTVRENVTYGLRLRGELEEERVERIMRRLDLVNLADRPARSLSGGEIQRVALARSLVIEPEVLLLDEPTANLDPYNVQLIEAIIQYIHQEGQTTVILVTHNLAQVQRLADRVAMLYSGELAEVLGSGEWTEQSRDPRTNAYVAGKIFP